MPNATKHIYVDPASTVIAPMARHIAPPRVTMTLDGLISNYDSIIRAGALYYPVAYQFARELGRGRQGRVFLAQRQGGRGCITEHAIKIFDPRIYHSPEEYWTDMGRIASQVSRMQRIQSPNLVSRHNYDETFGIGYLEMEAIDGMDLRRFLSHDHLELARKNCPPKDWPKRIKSIFRIEKDKVSLQPGIVVYILRGVLRGLECMNELNFIHSDIKPGNIMIDRHGNVNLVDFGRAVIAGEKLTFLLGSPMYMAPEVHRRETSGVEADLYSLGLVALEMLRGRRLLDGDNLSEDDLITAKMTLTKRLTEILPRHVTENTDLVSILKRFIEPDPTKRYRSAMDAEVGDLGLKVVDKQLVKAGLDTEYSRDLSDYLDLLVDSRTNRIEPPVMKDS
jgi:serine/threonine-protein kinase